MSDYWAERCSWREPHDTTRLWQVTSDEAVDQTAWAIGAIGLEVSRDDDLVTLRWFDDSTEDFIVSTDAERVDAAGEIAFAGQLARWTAIQAVHRRALEHIERRTRCISVGDIVRFTDGCYEDVFERWCPTPCRWQEHRSLYDLSGCGWETEVAWCDGRVLVETSTTFLVKQIFAGRFYEDPPWCDGEILEIPKEQAAPVDQFVPCPDCGERFDVRKAASWHRSLPNDALVRFSVEMGELLPPKGRPPLLCAGCHRQRTDVVELLGELCEGVEVEVERSSKTI